MEITSKMVQDLRAKTGAGIMDCKRALAEAEGDIEKAIDILRKKGLASVAKKAGRITSEGLVSSYIHMGSKIGVLVEVNCETDFVARTEQFQQMVKDIAMHIAAANPLYLKREDVPAEILNKEREIYREQFLASGKPEKVVDKIVEGKIESYFGETCLYEQPFVRETEKTVQTIVNEAISKFGENINVRRFARFVLGEGLEKQEECAG